MWTMETAAESPTMCIPATQARGYNHSIFWMDCFSMPSSESTMNHWQCFHFQTQHKEDFTALWKYLTCFPGGTSGKESTCQCRRHKRRRFNPCVREIPWSRIGQPTPVFLPGKFHGQWSLVGYRPWGHKQSDTTERTCTLICSRDVVISNISQNPKE